MIVNINNPPPQATDALSTPVPPPPPSATDTAVAGFITSAPALIVFGVLVGLIIYLIRERLEVTRLLARGMSEDMAKSIVDTFIKGVFSVAGTVNRAIPGEFDDKVIDGLARDAGLVRTPNASGTGFTWQPLPGFVEKALASPYAGMERVTLPDGSYAYKPGGARAGQSRVINDDGSYTLDTSAG